MSLDIFAKYATDESLEANGTWREIGGGAELLVARAGNKAYSKLLTKLVENSRKVLDLNDDVADAKSDEIMVAVMANTVLLDWKGISFKGEDLPYSVENAKKLLAIKDFRKVVSGFSEDLSAFRAKEEAAQGEA